MHVITLLPSLLWGLCIPFSQLKSDLSVPECFIFYFISLSFFLCFHFVSFQYFSIYFFIIVIFRPLFGSSETVYAYTRSGREVSKKTIFGATQYVTQLLYLLGCRMPFISRFLERLEIRGERVLVKYSVRAEVRKYTACTRLIRYRTKQRCPM